MNRIRSAALLICLFVNVSGSAMASGVGSITSIIEPMTRQVVQRRDDNVGNILVIGTYTGNVTGFQGSSTLLPGTLGTPLGWTSLIDLTIFEGHFVGIFRQPAGGFYTLQIRPTFQGQAGEPMAVLAVGVGEVFLTAGQSNTTNYGSPTGFAPNPLVSAFDDGVGRGIDPNYPGAFWQYGIDPQPAIDLSSMGSPWPSMASNLAETLGVPIGLYAAGCGGTSIEEWLPGYVFAPTLITPEMVLFNRLTNAIEYFTVRGGVRAVLWMQGETDYNLQTSGSVYAAQLHFIIQQSTTCLTSNLAERIAIEQAQASVVDDILTFPGPNADLIGLSYRIYLDGLPVHFNASGLILLGGYWGIYVANLPGFLYGGALPPG
jgi:hypothetical protein